VSALLRSLTLDTKVWATRGVLRAGKLPPGALTRCPPGAKLSDVVDLFWIIRMDLAPGETFVAETLPHPCVNVVITPEGSHLYGPVRGRFTLALAGSVRCVSVRFRPGAFHALTGRPAWQSVGVAVDFTKAFGVESRGLERELFGHPDDAARIGVLADFLSHHLPAPDTSTRQVVELVEGAIARITTDQELTKVEELAYQMGLSKRALERLFRLHVGLTPKWVIRQYRLQAAAEQVAGGGALPWSRLAQDLGYADQAHFNRDFRTVLGLTPTQFSNQAHARSASIPS